MPTDKRQKILIIEDDTNLRDFYSMRLGLEYDVLTAANGEEGLAVAVKELPDLIILDVMMPKISGFGVLDILRGTESTKKIPVMMMTALSQDADKKKAEELGANHYLVKSQVTLEDFAAAVKSALSGSQ